MLNRRTFLGGMSATLPLLGGPGVLLAQDRWKLHAIIVGINTYTGTGGDGKPIRALKGCINDATHIEEQVKRYRPATLVRLGGREGAEEPVTKAQFFATWEQTLAAAQRGDRLLLTFAGHGSLIPVLPGNPSGEKNGYDSTLVLTGFDARRGRSNEHIIDDELYALFLAAHARGVIVCFIADSCHSGTLTRSIDPHVSETTYRFVVPPPRNAPVTTPPGTPPPLPPNLVFLAGAQEDETVPEIRDPVTQKPRGALSLAVGRALEGGAVTDGAIRVGTLANFVRRQIRLLAEGVQNANITWPTPVTQRTITGETELFVLARAEDAPPAPSPQLRLRINGRSQAEAEGIIRRLHNARLPGAGEVEALVWDADRKLVLNNLGDRIADNIGESDLQGAVDCRLALDRIIQMAANGLDVSLEINGRDTRASDATHKPGEKLTIKVKGLAADDYLVVFNLAGTGMVQLLDPTPYRSSNPTRADFSRREFTTGRQALASEVTITEVTVDADPPFGADTVIAIAGARPMTRLMAALVASHRRVDVSGVMDSLAGEQAAQPEGKPLKIGLRGIYTWPT